MPYIAVYQSLLTHRKTLRLARLLAMDRYEVVGRLIALWCWTIDNAPEGIISRRDADILAEVMGWEHDPFKLHNALVTCGFLDTTDASDDDDELYAVHDWPKYLHFTQEG